MTIDDTSIRSTKMQHFVDVNFKEICSCDFSMTGGEIETLIVLAEKAMSVLYFSCTQGS